MNYQLIYDKLIAKCKLRGLDKTLLDGYYETHHIVPRCLGGNDEDSNLVLLTVREHFVAHRLLTKFTTGLGKYKMLAALAALRMGRDGNRWMNSRQIRLARQANSERLSELGALGLHQFQTEGFRQASSERMTQRNSELAAQGIHNFQTEEFRQALSQRNSELAAQGIHNFQTEEFRQASSERMSEKAAQGLHPAQTEKYKQALSKRSKIQYTCPVCGKVGKGPAMKRYHFDNCKFIDRANTNG